MFSELKDNIRDLSALLEILSYWVRDRIRDRIRQIRQ